ncbi:MAG: DUF1294 domain-containing protein [Oscillospiraceae bacterium]
MMYYLLAAYLIIINLYGFYICYFDKRAAKKGQYRIPEKRFFTVAVLCGGLGVLCGMYTFRHKTKHWYFVLGIPTILIAELLLAVYIYYINFK